MAKEQDMRRTRKKHSTAFKAKVAVAAIKGDRTIAELASDSGVHAKPDLQLEKAIARGRSGVVAGSVSAEGAINEAQFDLLYRQIGQLKVENDFFWH
jgi:transposase-like protein